MSLTLRLYERKINKVIADNFKEIDSDDLASFSTSSLYETSKLPSMTVDGKTILEWFAINGFSCWWFVYSMIDSKLRESTFFIDCLDSCLKHYSPNILVVKGYYDKMNLISQICKKNNVTVKIPKFNFALFQLRHRLTNTFKRYAYGRITLKKHQNRFRLYKTQKNNISFEKGSTIITAPGIYNRTMTDPITGKTERQEFILQPIIDILKQNQIRFFCFDLDYTFRGDTKPLLERLQSDVSWLPIEILLMKSKSEYTKNSISILKKSVCKLINYNPSEIITFKEIKLWDYLKPTFIEMFSEPYLPTYLHLINELEQFLIKNPPTVIIQVYETGPYAKAFEVVAKKLGIRTIAVQHAIIYDGNPNYMHREYWEKNNTLGNPIPDLTLVFGEHFKKILVDKCNYPKEKIAVIGNPTFYGIERIKQELTKESLRMKYQILGKNIILIALTFRIAESKNNPDRLLLEILYDHFKNSKEVTVLIRPHPMDGINGEQILRSKFLASNFLYSKASLTEDILISDVVVTTFSSVGIDAIVLDKPVIFAKLMGIMWQDFQHDPINKGVVVTCGKDDLIPKIVSILNGEYVYTKESARKEFLESYFNLGIKVDLLKIIYG